MEKLFKQAIGRFKTKFLRYFLTYVLGVGISILTVLALLLVAGLFAVIVLLTGKSPIVIGILATIFVLGAILALMYISSWTLLAKLTAIADQKTNDVLDCFRQTRGNVLGFVGFAVLSGLFFLGMAYTNILLFIPALVWSIWGAFAQFAFLEGKRGGLKPLWYSKAKVKGHFGKVFLYLAVIYVSAYIVSFLSIQINEKMVYVNSLLWFLFTPFVLAYLYEIYKSLPEPKEVKAPTGWIVASVIGWVAMTALIVLGISKLPQALKNVDTDKLLKELEKSNQYQQSYPTRIN